MHGTIVPAVRILITGADGFIGRALVARLLAMSSPFELILLDQAFASPCNDPRVQRIVGNITDPTVVARAAGDRIDRVFHLAAVRGGHAEAEFQLGLRVNLEATGALLEALRHSARVPRVVFASSLQVYDTANLDRIDERTVPVPKDSFGTHKLIGELLVSDYSRRGFIDGRSLRLSSRDRSRCRER